MADHDSDILERLMANNRTWAAQVERDNPGFFERLSKQQTPRVLWIGCSDSRVPGNESIGVMPGEIFFHRNIANQMQMVDFNGLSVLQYAVDWLRVRHIIICGHYGCGGVKTALKQNELGLLNNWLYGVGELSRRHKERLDALPDRNHRIDALCEFNVIEQVRNVCRTRSCCRPGGAARMSRCMPGSERPAAAEGSRRHRRRRSAAEPTSMPRSLGPLSVRAPAEPWSLCRRIQHLFDSRRSFARRLRVHSLLVFALSMAFILLFNRRPDAARWTSRALLRIDLRAVRLFLAFHGADIWKTKAQAEHAYRGRQRHQAARRDDVAGPTRPRGAAVSLALRAPRL